MKKFLSINIIKCQHYRDLRPLEGKPASYPGESIKLIHAAHAKAAQAIEQHIAPGYEAEGKRCHISLDIYTIFPKNVRM